MPIRVQVRSIFIDYLSFSSPLNDCTALISDHTVIEIIFNDDSVIQTKNATTHPQKRRQSVAAFRQSKIQKLREIRGSILDRVENQIKNGMNPNSEFAYSQPQVYEINNQISDHLLTEYQNIFRHYLQILCQNGTALPTDCNDLLNKMINISIKHSFNISEVKVLAHRIEYLADSIPQTMPYFFIQLNFVSLM